MGWECHWVWRNVCFSYRHFTCPVTPCPPRARLIFGKAATRTGPLCGGFALGRCCPVLVAALPLWVIRGQFQVPFPGSRLWIFRTGLALNQPSSRQENVVHGLHGVARRFISSGAWRALASIQYLDCWG